MARTRLIRNVTAWLLAVVALIGMAKAHQAPNSEAYLDFQADRVELEVVIPGAEYSYASGNRIAADEVSRAQARRYLSGLISASGGAARWDPVVVGADEGGRVDGGWRYAEPRGHHGTGPSVCVDDSVYLVRRGGAPDDF